MKDKKRILIFTENKNIEYTQAIKDYLALNKSQLPIIIGEEEFQNIFFRLVKEKYFSDEGFVVRTADIIKDKFSLKKFDKLPKQDIVFNKSSSSCQRALNMFLRYHPNLVILTSAYKMKEILSARMRSHPEVPVVMIMPSFTLNKQCINKQIDLYVVDNLGVKKGLMKEGVAESKILVSDMPLTPEFDTAFDKNSIYEQYSFTKHKITVLVSVPQGNTAGIKEAFAELGLAKQEFNIIADCGYDRKMLVSARDAGLTAVNEGANVNAIYAIADAVVGRPVLSSVAKAYYRNALFFALPPANEEEKRAQAYLSGSLINVKLMEMDKKEKTIIITEDTLVHKLQEFRKSPKSFDSFYQAIESHNAERTRGALFKKLDELLGKGK
ncbi:MAG: hypothetical protein FWD49_03340 [Firmicutes bacterium]|nr:hypothetical protein [Bacillota bacterium]